MLYMSLFDMDQFDQRLPAATESLAKVMQQTVAYLKSDSSENGVASRVPELVKQAFEADRQSKSERTKSQQMIKSGIEIVDVTE